MKVLQWSMTIPKNKQVEFLKWFNKVAVPKLTCFGALKHEIYEVSKENEIGKQLVENNRFIERIYFPDDFNLPDYFVQIKENEEKWKISRMYEDRFNATNIVLRVLTRCHQVDV